MNKAILIILLLLLAGCEQQQIQCPKCEAPTQTTEETYLYIDYIDVGQGDAELIQYEGQEMLIDCGKNTEGPALVSHLKSKGVTKLEYLLITHPDSDHLGGCDDVLDQIPTDIVILNGEVKDTASYKEVIAKIDAEKAIIATEGQEWSIGASTMQVIQSSINSEDTNQNSIVTKLTLGSFSALFMGDCDRDCEDRLSGKGIDVDVLKVAHHGSKYGTGLKFLEEATPEIAIIEVGENDYGHPAQETLDRLEQEGIAIYRTDTGTIKIKTNGEGFQIVT